MDNIYNEGIDIYADLMNSHIQQCVNDMLAKQTRLIGAIVQEVDEQGRVSVVLPSENNTVFSNISNQTPFDLAPGDGVELLLKDGSFSNCWIIAKHQVTNSNRADQLSGGTTDSVSYQLQELENLINQNSSGSYSFVLEIGPSQWEDNVFSISIPILKQTDIVMLVGDGRLYSSYGLQSQQNNNILTFSVIKTPAFTSNIKVGIVKATQLKI